MFGNGRDRLPWRKFRRGTLLHHRWLRMILNVFAFSLFQLYIYQMLPYVAYNSLSTQKETLTIEHTIHESYVSSYRSSTTSEKTKSRKAISSHPLHNAISEEHVSGNIHASISIQDRTSLKFPSAFYLHLFLFRRAQSAKELLSNIAAADYGSFNSSIHLNIHVDYSDSEDVRNIAEDFVWPYGSKILDFKEIRTGLRDSWISAWPNPEPNEVMIAFEDDVRVSPLYFQWILKLLDSYWTGDPFLRDPQLLGFSLSSLKLDEISYPFRPWSSYEYIPGKPPVYLHSVPSSWGAVYFGDKWKEFLDFYNMRTAHDFYELNETKYPIYGVKLGDHNLHIPDSRTNSWSSSWKRFMIDFAFGRGYYMIYPNFSEGAAFATTLHLPGEHVPSSNVYTDPRTGTLLNKTWPLHVMLPSTRELKVVDMHCQLTTKADLMNLGDTFLDNVEGLGPRYSQLVSYWRRPCLLDVIQGAARRASSNKGGQKFLFFAPQMGMNNQLIAIVHALQWAKILDRKLIIPHLFFPRVNAASSMVPDEWVEYTDVFDISDISKLGPFKHAYVSPEHLRYFSPERIIAMEKTPLFDTLDTYYLSYFGWGNVTRIPLREYIPENLNSNLIQARLGTCHDQIMVFDGMYYSRPSDLNSESFGKLLSHVRKPNSLTAHVIHEAANTIKLTFNMSNYTCMHMRLGDFIPMCNADSNMSTWIDHLRAQGFNCSVTSDLIRRALKQSGDKYILLISNDIPAAVELFPKENDKLLFTSTNIMDIVQKRLSMVRKTAVEVMAAVVEQEICSAASQVWLNRYSTFSAGVTTMRKSMEGINYW